MRDTNPHSAMSRAYYSALLTDMPGTPIEQPSGGPLILRPREADLEVIHFRQIWGTTALGFLHKGQSRMTAAYTTVITDKRSWCVYFDGRLAYLLRRPNAKFFEDLSNRVLRPIKYQNYYLDQKPAQAA
jgi:hypothetical protein